MFLEYPVDVINIRQEFSSKHHGVDLGWDSNFKGSKNQEIKAVADGVVVYNRHQTSGGYVIGIYHPKYNLTSEYGHLLKNSQRVHEGDTVKKGQAVAILEAMKMENEIAACADGKITFAAQKGANVDTGDILAYIG